MIGKLALDSNAVIAYRSGDNLISPFIMNASELYLPAPVMGELAYGALVSSQPDRNLELFLQFAAHCNILIIDMKVSLRYASVRKKLREQGDPIPENDIWIAAICLENELPLLTRDKHFDKINGLEVVGW